MRIHFVSVLAPFAAVILPVLALGQAPAPDAVKPPVPAPAAQPDASETPKPAAPAESPKGGNPALPQRYQSLLVESMNLFHIRDYAGALKFVDRADEIMAPTTWSLNIRGAVAIEQRDFAKGQKYCADALKVDANFFPAKFNLCEIPFLQEKYADARGLWMKLYGETKKEDPTSELLVYRIFLTFLLEKDFDHAKDWLAKIPFPSQTPAYHYAHAAMERQLGNKEKWDEWLNSAVYIWPDSKRASFTDVLIQLGWMKREP